MTRNGKFRWRGLLKGKAKNMQNSAIYGVRDDSRELGARTSRFSFSLSQKKSYCEIEKLCELIFFAFISFRISLTVGNNANFRLSLIYVSVCLYSCALSSLLLVFWGKFNIFFAMKNFMWPLCKCWGEMSWITLNLAAEFNYQQLEDPLESAA